ncbi:hypothetical protein GW17_00017060 [Ensete ventricosum]|nr:hypothetical protein GW17_00017060 [Ensete ventricosum]
MFERPFVTTPYKEVEFKLKDLIPKPNRMPTEKKLFGNLRSVEVREGLVSVHRKVGRLGLFLRDFFGFEAFFRGAEGFSVADWGANLFLRASWFKRSSCSRAKEIAAIRVYGCMRGFGARVAGKVGGLSPLARRRRPLVAGSLSPARGERSRRRALVELIKRMREDLNDENRKMVGKQKLSGDWYQIILCYNSGGDVVVKVWGKKNGTMLDAY